VCVCVECVWCVCMCVCGVCDVCVCVVCVCVRDFMQPTDHFTYNFVVVVFDVDVELLLLLH